MNQYANPAFDATADTFERHRSLPREVPEAIRRAMWSVTRLQGSARVLEIGAGTGRIGKVFAEAGDFYVGVDNSFAMLRGFAARSKKCLLVQADARRLPFGDCGFEVVLLMHVLGGVDDWRGMLEESRRVLRPRGNIVVGHTLAPEWGIDAQLKRRLAAILDEMQVDAHRPEQSRQDALAWLDCFAMRHAHSQAVSWQVSVSVKEFLLRHRTGAWFAALPVAVQELALDKLRTWAEENFGSMDHQFRESRSFELDIFEFEGS